MLNRHMPAITTRHRQIDKKRVEDRDERKRKDGRRNNIGRQLVEVITDFNLAAALFGHLAAPAVHLLAAIVLHPSHLRSHSAGEHRHQHDEHG